MTVNHRLSDRYNSVIYSTVSALDYAILLVPDDLASNEPLAAEDDNFERGFFDTVGTSAADIQTEIFDGTYRDVEAKECLDTYNTEFNSDLDTLIAVTNRHFFHNTTVLKARINSGLFSEDENTPFLASSLYGYVTASKRTTQELVEHHDFKVPVLRFEYPSWEVTVPDYESPSQEASFNLTIDGGTAMFAAPASEYWERDLNKLCQYVILDNPDKEAIHEYLTAPETWINSSWTASVVFEQGKDPAYSNQIGLDGDFFGCSLPEIPISRCMVKHRRPLCQLTFSPNIAVVVIVSNMIKVACMYLTARTSRTHLLLTVGDAISSFLANPDQATQDQRNKMRSSDGSRSSSVLPGPSQHEDKYIHRQAYYTSLAPMNVLFRRQAFSATVQEFIPGARKKWYRAVSTKRWTMALTL